MVISPMYVINKEQNYVIITSFLWRHTIHIANTFEKYNEKSESILRSTPDRSQRGRQPVSPPGQCTHVAKSHLARARFHHSQRKSNTNLYKYLLLCENNDFLFLFPSRRLHRYKLKCPYYSQRKALFSFIINHNLLANDGTTNDVCGKFSVETIRIESAIHSPIDNADL